MRRGVWHQCGFNSQKMVSEMLKAGVGVGAIISPRDLALDNAKSYAKEYHDSGAGVLLDPQFYQPEYSDGKLSSYPIFAFRQSIDGLGALQPSVIAGLSKALESENRDLGCEAMISPAIPYEAARPDIVQLNARLFDAAKAAGDVLGVPTFATVVLGKSSTTASVVEGILSSATALPADGWYYGFEFDEDERLPTDVEAVYRYCAAALTLACSGKPVLNAYAGPLANVAFGAGARGAAIGFWQNLWGFSRSRYQPSSGQGGGGDAPPRFFSTPLWGTVVYPDEALQLDTNLRAEVMTHSPFSQSISSAAGIAWPKWDAYRHMVYMIVEATTPLASARNARSAMQSVVAALTTANALHARIRAAGLQVRDSSDKHQPAWAAAGTRLLANNTDDYDWLELQGGP